MVLILGLDVCISTELPELCLEVLAEVGPVDVSSPVRTSTVEGKVLLAACGDPSGLVAKASSPHGRHL